MFFLASLVFYQTAFMDYKAGSLNIVETTEVVVLDSIIMVIIALIM